MLKYLIFFALAGYTLALSPAALLATAGGGSYHRSSSGSADDVHAEIKALHSDVRHDGFDYTLETTNGIHAAQSGDDHGNVHGDYEYGSPEGEHIKVTYVADEHGYQPQSDILPTPPPIPAEILKALKYIEAHPSVEEHHGGHGLSKERLSVLAG